MNRGRPMARAHERVLVQNVRDFPQSKLDSEINAPFLLRGYGTLKYGDVHEKFNFSEMQLLRPLRTCQKHFETILPNFLLDECEI